MSSLRNAVKRITHKERGQVQRRQHLGLLEKKGDYVERAADYQKKRKHVTTLREKAAFRNPDEFYFGMHNAEVKDGRHRKTVEARRKQFEADVGGADMIRIMKDQDLSYIRLQKIQDTKKAERLASSLHYLEGEASPGEREHKKKRSKHTVFVDSKEEAEKFDVAKHFDTLPELAGRAFNRPRIEALKKRAFEDAGYGDDPEREEERDGLKGLSPSVLAARRERETERARAVAKARAAAYGEMEARQRRAEAMATAEAHLLTEKWVAAKGRKRKVRAAERGQPAQYKWRRKRLG